MNDRPEYQIQRVTYGAFIAMVRLPHQSEARPIMKGDVPQRYGSATAAILAILEYVIRVGWPANVVGTQNGIPKRETVNARKAREMAESLFNGDCA